MLPQLWPEEWAKSKFREWHIGHKHTKAMTKFYPIVTEGGVIIRQIPSLATIDKWHSDHAFTDGVPASESFLWDKEWGIVQNNTANVLYKEDES